MRHMREHARKAVELLQGKTRANLESDEVLQLALSRLVEIVGEAASRIPKDVRAQHPGIPWRAAVSMRNWLIHVYHHVEVDRLWDVVADDLPPLVAELDRILGD